MNFILVETNTILAELRNPRNIAIYIVLAGFMTVFTLVWISVVHCYLKDIRQRYVLRQKCLINRSGVKIRAGRWRFPVRFLFLPVEIFPKFTKMFGSLETKYFLTNYTVIQKQIFVIRCNDTTHQQTYSLCQRWKCFVSTPSSRGF